MAAFDNDAQFLKWSMQTTTRLSQQVLLTGLTNRAWQAEAEGEPPPREIKIFTFDSQNDFDSTANTSIVNYDNAMVWADAVEDGYTEQSLLIDRAAVGSRFYHFRDFMQLPLSVQTQLMQALPNQMAHQLDQIGVADFIGDGTANSRGIDTNANDATDGIEIIGTSSNYINAQGQPQGTGMPKALYDLVLGFRDYAEETGFGFGSTQPFFHWLLMPNRLISILTEYVLDNKVHGGSLLGDSILGDNGLRMLGGGAMRRSRGSLHGVELLSASDLLPTATVSGKSHWQILGGTSRAFAMVTQSMLTQNFPPQQNPIGTGDPSSKANFAKPGGLFRQIFPFGCRIVNRREARLYRVRREA